MTEPFKITWQEPSEGQLPAGTKIRRDTGLVAELKSAAWAYWRSGGWQLFPAEGSTQMLIDIGGVKCWFEDPWIIDAVGLRDDGLLWTLPTKECELPEGMRIRTPTGHEYVVPEGGARFMAADGSSSWNVAPKIRGMISGWSASELGFPRPFPRAINAPLRCDGCGVMVHDFSACCSWRIGGVTYISCGGHGADREEGFLRTALALREEEADEAFRERVRNALVPPPLEPTRQPDPVDRDALAREAARDQARAAKVAELGRLLRQPMAPRFAAEPQAIVPRYRRQP